MAAVRDQGFGGSGGGLFDEAGDAVDAGSDGEGLADFDIAVAGLGAGGFHAEGDEKAGFGGRDGGGQRGGEGFGLGDGGVGGHHPEDGAGVLFGD